jgi:ABC-type antimicrobial peptide transport system permease subunit
MIIGCVAIGLGLWGLVTYLWYIVDILIGAFPLALLTFGIVALLAGVKNTGFKASMVKNIGMLGFTCPTAKNKNE